MRKTEAPCTISGVAVSKIELVVGGANDMSLKVRANLVDELGTVHAVSERVGGWSENAIAAVHELVASVEDDLVRAHFESEDYGNAERHTPTGILDLKLGTSGS